MDLVLKPVSIPTPAGAEPYESGATGSPEHS